MKQQKKSYSFRLNVDIGASVERMANENRRTTSAEIGLLIEQGIAWRKEHGNKVPSPE